MIGTNNQTLIHEPINEEYEWIQYNEQLRIIHSINDDMFQLNSIIRACNSRKLAKDWFANQSTQELLAEIDKDQKNSRMGEFPSSQKVYENRRNLPNGLRGYYVHRLLVNHVAMWASPKYAWYIMKLLDDLFNKQREQLEQKVEEMKPRQVPRKKEKQYKYMIWKEETDDNDLIKLHLVRRNKRVFSQVSKIKNDPEKCWFYRENLPIAMTPNEDVKDLIRKTLPGSEYYINACTITVFKEHLDLLHQIISEYFDNFRNL